MSHGYYYVSVLLCELLTTYDEVDVYFYMCRDSNHLNQSDVEFVMPTFFCRLTKMLSRIDPVAAHQVNQEMCHAFLKRHQLQGVCGCECVQYLFVA